MPFIFFQNVLGNTTIKCKIWKVKKMSAIPKQSKVTEKPVRVKK